MSNVYVFEIEVNRFGTEELIKKLYYLGRSLFEVNHMAMEDIYGDEEGQFQTDAVEIGMIRKVKGVGVIENPEYILEIDDENGDSQHGYDPQMPFDMLSNKDIPGDMHMKFRHSCGEEIICVDFEWPYILCTNKDCSNKRIDRKDIEEVGGIYLFHGA